MEKLEEIEKLDKIKKQKREWYYRNRAHVQAYNTNRKKEVRAWLKDVKKELVCSKCGEDHISCIEYHHINPSEKEINLGRVVEHGWSKQRILKEMEKCIPLCANCHRKEHYSN